MIKVLVKNYIYRGRTFTICTNDELIENEVWYLAIEDKYITNGRLNQRLNIAQMNGGHTFKECEERVHTNCDIDFYLENGMEPAEALCRVMNMMDKLEEVKKIF